MDRPK